VKRALALIALGLVAVYGLLLGPRYGEGTDTRAARLVPGAPSSSVPGALASWAPRSDADEQLRFAVLGGGALFVLAVILIAWREPMAGAEPPSS
jgi:peptidoglycan/LPS O-acetylase OafA/YrhL